MGKREVFTEVAGQRADGQLVARTLNAAGAVVREDEASVAVEQHGGVDGDVVLRVSGAARDHFELYVKACRDAGGKFIDGGWRFSSSVGADVADKLQELGFNVALSQRMRGDLQISTALAHKFGLDYTLGAVVELGEAGFVVVTLEGRRLPCTLAEALLLDERGAEFTLEALGRVRSIRASAGFPNEGRGRADDEDAGMTSIPLGLGSTPVRVPVKVGRNEPCPCGSGKKFKKCCDAVAGD